MTDLVLIAKELKGNEVVGYIRMDNYNFLPKDSVKILDVPFSIGIVCNKDDQIIKMKHKGIFSIPEANALLLEQKINGTDINSLYSASYCKIPKHF